MTNDAELMTLVSSNAKYTREKFYTVFFGALRSVFEVGHILCYVYGDEKIIKRCIGGEHIAPLQRKEFDDSDSFLYLLSEIAVDKFNEYLLEKIIPHDFGEFFLLHACRVLNSRGFLCCNVLAVIYGMWCPISEYSAYVFDVKRNRGRSRALEIIKQGV